MLQRSLQIVKEDGVTGLGNRAAAFAYRRLRRLLPTSGHVRYAGIPIVYERRWGDRIVPSRWIPGGRHDLPDYESALVAALREQVRSGDRIVVVGGGVGVTAAIAALQTGSSGEVICFEGASEGVEKVRQTADLNGVSDRMTVHHAVVGRSVLVYGTEPDHEVLTPAELPDCDVLELDCEGAEVDILQEMAIRPRAVLVETHGLYGATTPLVASLMEGLGYAVSDLGVAEPRVEAFCQEHDIRVLVGVQEWERSSP